MIPAAVAVALVRQLMWAVVGAGGSPVGCPDMDRCGDVSVPYPFGIRDGCSLSGFRLTCDATRRLMLGSTLQVVDISLADSTVRVMDLAGVVDITPYSEFIEGGNGTWTGASADGVSGPYVVSEKLNELVITGCNIQVTLVGGTENVIIGCSSFCSINDIWGLPLVATIPGDKCSGVGCCRTNITIGRPTYGVLLKHLDETLELYAGQVPIAIRIAERGWFDGLAADLLKKPAENGTSLLTPVPVVLEWAVASTVLLVVLDAERNKQAANNWSCPTPGEARRSACLSSNSYCHNVTGNYRRGYVCRCDEGYDGNPYVADGCQDINECERAEEHGCYGECTNTPGAFVCRCPHGARGNATIPNGCTKSNLGLTIGIGFGSGAGLFLVALGAVFLTRKIKHRRARMLRQKFFKQNRGNLLLQLVSQKADIAERMIIPLAELEKATNNFDETRELGGGGHGTVYKGILSDLHVVAIKKSKVTIQREIDEFINEVAILSQINHRNVVKLFGCCLETEVPLLVYEFISNGTLYHHLHVDGPTSLLWQDRLRIATETARALAYLHSAVSFPIIHRDIKSHNILLDGSFTTKVSDFGASRCIPAEQTGITTAIQGTMGYLDPMYYYTGRLTEKSDVYSFGVVLVELLTRKKPYSYRSHEDDSLVVHFTTLLRHDNLFDILDPQVMEEGGKEVKEVAMLAVECVKLKAEERPTMRQVEMTLENIRSSFLQQEEVPHIMDRRKSIENHVSGSNPIIDGTNMESTRQYSLEEEYLLSSRHPRMSGMAVALAILLVGLAPATPSSSAQQPPGCPAKCGNISIPYPFGIGARCARDEGFQLECNHTSSPPCLIVSNSTGGHRQQLLSLSLADGEARAFLNAKRRCYNSSTGDMVVENDQNSTEMSLSGTPYRFSKSRNRLVALGCPNLAYLVDGRGSYISSCTSICRTPESVAAGSTVGFTGEGCCQSSIPYSVDIYKPDIIGFKQGKAGDSVLLNSTAKAASILQSSTFCRYMYLAEDKWIDAAYRDGVNFNRSDDFAVHVVLDWAVRNAGNCSAAKRNATANYACRSAGSECVDTSDGDGYRCNCSKGYEGNPYLDGGCKDIDECKLAGKCFGDCTNTPGDYECRCPRGARGDPRIPNGCVKTNLGLSVGIGVGSGAGLLVMGLGAAFLIRKVKKQRARMLRQKFFKQNRGHLLQQLVSQKADIAERMIIPLPELEKATNNFDKSRELGGGGHGTVYKGILSDLHVVAIKKSKEAVQREIDEFINEVAILSQINHRNVVKLFGCCLETEVPLLVYEFISNGTLYHHLHVEGPTSLPWEARLRIATETARALAYLHSAVSFPIIHRDIKSHNILLDGSLTTKVSDFGASRCIPAEQTGITTAVQGTLGYLDPMYYYTGRLTEKSDVFSFGVVLIELLTRKKPYAYRSSDDESLVAHFTTLLTQGNLGDILDPQVKEEGGEEVKEVAVLAVACVKLKAEERPTMRQVEMTLESVRSSSLQQEVLHGVGAKKPKENHVSWSYPVSEGTSIQSTRQYSLEEEYLLSSSAEEHELVVRGDDEGLDGEKLGLGGGVGKKVTRISRRRRSWVVALVWSAT
uniref:Protein kinase domain-containing protein n=1 Tax=Oryza punctata TaxID=4537 RepID=A0A0E0M4K3_ORYPU